MEGAPTRPTLRHAEAAQWNQDLMLQFQAALEQDPAVDLSSMFPDVYRREHRSVQRLEKRSWAASINLRTMHKLQNALEKDQEVDLLSIIPVDYAKRIKVATEPKREPPTKTTTKTQTLTQFRSELDAAKEATIVFPLSDEVTTLLSKYSQDSNLSSNGIETSLVRSLKNLLWDSPVLYDEFCSMVVKCNQQVVAKVNIYDNDHTEYTNIQYLEKQAPDIPAPRPHGLIMLGEYRVIFMSYIGDVTLAKVWTELSHEEKASIQHQLDDIFRRLRTLRQADGEELGGVCGEAVKIHYGFGERAQQKHITGARQFWNFMFSIPHHHCGGTTCLKLLSGILDNTTMGDIVFTHGDIRRENIMVKRDLHKPGAYVISGIIDWDFSGFYPDFFESTNLTRKLNFGTEDDWYLYIPQSILSPGLTVQFLIERIWQTYRQAA